MSPARRILLAALVGALMMAGCSAKDESTTPSSVPPSDEHGRELVDEGPPREGGTLTIGVPSLTNAGWHPFADNWETAGHLIGSSVLETLTAYNSDGEIEMWLAESVEPSEDLKTWTITAREDVTFHDGTPLDGAALAANLNAAFFTGLGSIAFVGIIESVEQVGGQSVKVRFSRPIAVIPELLAGLGGYVAAPSMLDDPQGASNPIGTGPFTLDDWLPDSHFNTVRFENYWRTDAEGRQLPYLEGLNYQILPDPTARRAALDSGSVDLIVTTDASTVVDARDNDKFISVEDNFSEETFVMLNTAIPPFDNVKAREALAYGTDAAAVISVTQQDAALPATSPFAPGTPWEVADPGYPVYDPERATEAVAAYEAETGEALTFTFDGIPVRDTSDQQQLLIEQWAQLGIEASIDSLGPIPYITGITGGDYQAAWFRSYSYTDPLYFFAFFHSDFANGPGALSTNFSQIQNDTIDELLEEGMASQDPARRREIYTEVAQEINDELANIWLFHTPWAFIARPEVHGLNQPRAIGFASLEPKPWIGDLWLSSGG